MEFARPHLFWLFLIYIPLIFWYVYKIRKIDPTIQASTLDAVKNFRTSYRVWLRHGLFAVRLLAIGCLIVILCRPQTSNKWETSSVEGTDIVIALDMSTSMLAKDFTPDRFAAAKDVASEFISGRESDNIGLVVFAGESFTLLPMTTDKSSLLNAVSSVEMGLLEDGTQSATDLQQASTASLKAKPSRRASYC